MRIRVPGLALTLLLASLSLHAQLIHDSVTVEVIDVPVFVARGDQPVTGLTRDDFEVFVNGKPQPIDSFEEIAARGEVPTLRDRRLFLLLFDITFSRPYALPRAQKAAARVIANAAPGDYFAVATYSNRRGIWFAAPFTRDRDALGRAIRSLNNPQSGDPLAIVMTASERAAGADWSDADSFATVESARDIARMEALRGMEDQTEGLAELGERIAALQGQKHVVLLSEGWGGVELNVYDDIVAMHRRFDAAGVLLHAIDLDGTAGADEALYALTSGTGGKFLHSRNDIGRALTSLSASLDRGYRIGLRPDHAKRGYNAIEVRVRGRGLRVDHRRGFSSARELANPHDGLYLADVVLNDVPQSGTAAALTLRDDTLTATIPMRELAAQGKQAELLVYAFAADGSALMFHREVVAVTEDDAKAFVIAMPAGTTVAKALLRIDGSVGFSKVGRMEG